MTQKAIWKGNIQFGDVDLPVKLHPATREDRIQFHLLHSRDHAKLHQQMICALENEPVPVEDQAKGFEAEEGKYIIVDPEELEHIIPERSRVIEVHEFIRSGQIHPLFLGRAYYLEPGVQKGYSTLVSILKELEIEGICTWTMRKRSWLGALQASGNILRLHTLHFADEVIPVNTLDLQKIPLPEKELKIGSELINQMTSPFQPRKFENEHEKMLKNLIDKKARGEKIAVLRPRRLRPTKPDKLLQVLEASLKKVA